MTRLEHLHPDTSMDQSTTRMFIIVAGIVLAQMTLQISLATGMSRWPAMGAGAVVAFLAGVSLAGYETSSTVRKRNPSRSSLK